MKNIEEYEVRIFENIKHVDELENEYWETIELQQILGYKYQNR